MWRRREPERTQEEPAAQPEAAAPPASEAAPDPRATEPPDDITSDDEDPYAELENIFEEPILLEDPAPVAPTSPPAAAPRARRPSPPPPRSGAELAKQLWGRLDELETELQAGSARTLEALRRLGERFGAELAMLDKRAVNLELTVARLRSVTEAMELALRRGAPRAPQAAPEPETPDRPAESPTAPEGSLFGPNEVRPNVWSDEPTD